MLATFLTAATYSTSCVCQRTFLLLIFLLWGKPEIIKLLDSKPVAAMPTNTLIRTNSFLSNRMNYTSLKSETISHF